MIARWEKHRVHGWCVASYFGKPGDVVSVEKADGSVKRVTLGECVQQGMDNRSLFKPANAAPVESTVGDLSAILQIFERAKTHLQHPAIVLGPRDGAPGIRVTIAGPRAKAPGSLTITSAERDGEEGRAWYGRVLLNGTFQPSREAVPAIATRLRQFAAAPAQIAAEHGRLTGRCCFCNRALTDERSTAVGYGETCASHFGMPWGAQKIAGGDLFGAAA